MGFGKGFDAVPAKAYLKCTVIVMNAGGVSCADVAQADCSACVCPSGRHKGIFDIDDRQVGFCLLSDFDVVGCVKLP